MQVTFTLDVNDPYAKMVLGTILGMGEIRTLAPGERLSDTTPAPEPEKPETPAEPEPETPPAPEAPTPPEPTPAQQRAAHARAARAAAAAAKAEAKAPAPDPLDLNGPAEANGADTEDDFGLTQPSMSPGEAHEAALALVREIYAAGKVGEVKQLQKQWGIAKFYDVPLEKSYDFYASVMKVAQTTGLRK